MFAATGVKMSVKKELDWIGPEKNCSLSTQIPKILANFTTLLFDVLIRIFFLYIDIVYILPTFLVTRFQRVEHLSQSFTFIDFVRMQLSLNVLNFRLGIFFASTSWQKIPLKSASEETGKQLQNGIRSSNKNDIRLLNVHFCNKTESFF